LEGGALPQENESEIHSRNKRRVKVLFFTIMDPRYACLLTFGFFTVSSTLRIRQDASVAAFIALI
jgi:hypothetical protein